MGRAVYFGRVYCRLSLFPWCPSFFCTDIFILFRKAPVVNLDGQEFSL